MHISRSHAAALAAIVAAMGAAFGAATPAAAHPAHPAHSSAPAPVVRLTMLHRVIVVTGGTHLRPGTTIFQVRAHSGEHTAQIVRLHAGYTTKQFRKDAAAGLDNGSNLAAIHRLDHRMSWLGGATTNKYGDGEFAVRLRVGRYLVLDQDGNDFVPLNVSGASLHSAPPIATATFVGTAADRWTTPHSIPHDSWIELKDTSTEPHFLGLQKVKASTTHKQVAAFVRHVVKTGQETNPPWIVGPHTDSGVFSRHTRVGLHVNLPRGKYLVLCFWPSKDNGMPHFLMGMWKLINLT